MSGELLGCFAGLPGSGSGSGQSPAEALLVEPAGVPLAFHQQRALLDAGQTPDKLPGESTLLAQLLSAHALLLGAKDTNELHACCAVGDCTSRGPLPHTLLTQPEDYAGSALAREDTQKADEGASAAAEQEAIKGPDTVDEPLGKRKRDSGNADAQKAGCLPVPIRCAKQLSMPCLCTAWHHAQTEACSCKNLASFFLSHP